MNRTKKLASRSASIMLAAAMSTSMIATVTASAAEPTDEYIGTNATKYVNPTKKNTPDSTDRTRLRVFGIDDPSATVVAYHIIEANYNEFGVTGYTETAAAWGASKIAGFDKVTSNVQNVLVTDNNKKDAQGNINSLYNGGKIITEANISEIAADIIKKTKNNETFEAEGYESVVLTRDANGVYQTTEAEAGSYIVLVRKTTDDRHYTYNPMVISNDYVDANDAGSLGKDIEVRTGLIKDEDGKVTWGKYSNTYIGEDGKRYRGDVEVNGDVYASNLLGDIGNIDPNSNYKTNPRTGAMGDVNIDGNIDDKDIDWLTNWITLRDSKHDDNAWNYYVDWKGNQIKIDHDQVTSVALSAGDLNMDGNVTQDDVDVLKRLVKYVAAVKDLDPIADITAIKEAQEEYDIDDSILAETTVATMALQGRAYAKISYTTFEKNIVNASTADFSDLDYSKYDDLRVKRDARGTYTLNEDGTVNVNTVATFDIFTELPDYSNTYYASDDKFEFSITDTQGKGLDPVKAEDIKVYAAQFSAVEENKSEDQNKTYAETVALNVAKDENLLTMGTDYTVKVTENDFKVTFNQAWATSAENANKKIIVRYSTALNNDAVIGLDGNPNDATLTYTTVPGQTDNVYDLTTHYSFPMWATKVAENGEVNFSQDANFEDEDTTADVEVTSPLAGAKFYLKKIKDVNLNEKGEETISDTIDTMTVSDYYEAQKNGFETPAENRKNGSGEEGETTSIEWTLTSDENGILRFDDAYKYNFDENNNYLGKEKIRDGWDEGQVGLDTGVYALVEYEAPKGYTLNDKVYFVKISADYDEARQRSTGKFTENTLEEHRFINSYSIKIFDDGITGTDWVEEQARGNANVNFTEIDWTTLDNALFTETSLENAGNSLKYSWTKKDADPNTDNDAGEKIMAGTITAIPNTQLSRLPSTGGIGTLIFVVSGVGLMCGAIVLSSKKKEEKK